MKPDKHGPCICGSGKKYKTCCMNKENPPVDLSYRRLSAVHDALIPRLLKHAEAAFGKNATPAAMTEFMGDPEEPASRHLLELTTPVFLPWFLFNWVHDDDDSDIWLKSPAFTTVAGHFLETKGRRLESIERDFLKGVIERPFSFFEILEARPDEGLRLRNILSGDEIEVSERSGSKAVKAGDILFCRVVRVQNVAMMVGCSAMIIPPIRKPEIIRFREEYFRKRRTITEEMLKECDFELREHYIRILDGMLKPPQLRNTDGDPLSFQTLHFEIDSADLAFEKLHSLSTTRDKGELLRDAEQDRDGHILRAEITWDRKGHKLNKALDNTILGRLYIDKKKLTVEVNSGRRAERIRKEIEKRLGAHAFYKTTAIQPIEAMMEKAGQGKASTGVASKEDLIQHPEVRKKVAEMMEAHWKRWPDEKLPALGGKTPRHAVKTAAGRESVEALLLDAERHAAADKLMAEPGLAAIRQVRRLLGL